MDLVQVKSNEGWAISWAGQDYWLEPGQNVEIVSRHREMHAAAIRFLLADSEQGEEPIFTVVPLEDLDIHCQ